MRIKHETSSAVAEAALWMSGCGIKGDPPKVGLALEKAIFAAS